MNPLDLPMWKLAAAAEAAADKAGEDAKLAGVAVAGITRPEREVGEIRKSKKRIAPGTPRNNGVKTNRSLRRKHDTA